MQRSRPGPIRQSRTARTDDKDVFGWIGPCDRSPCLRSTARPPWLPWAPSSSTSSSSAVVWSVEERHSTRPPAASASVSWRPATSPRARRAGPASSSTAACAISRCSTSGWSPRPWRSGTRRWRRSPRTSSARCRSSTHSRTASGSASTRARVWLSTTRWPSCPGVGGCAAAPTPQSPGARRLMPALKKDALIGALHYYDGQVDDARHTMFLSRTAAAYGAHVASRTRVVSLLREGDRVTGARVKDLETGDEIDVAARQVINATGVWTDETQGAGGGARAVPRAVVEGHPPRRAARPHPRRVRAHPAHGEVGAVRHPVGTALDHRHHRHRLGSLEGPPAASRSTSTTCSSTSTRCWSNRSPTTTCRGLRGAASVAGRRGRGHQQALPRARRVHQHHGARRHRRRQVHDVPRHGQGRRRRCRAVDVDAPRPQGAPVLHRGRPAARCRRLRSGVEPAPEARRRRVGSASAAWSTCFVATGHSSPSCSS